MKRVSPGQILSREMKDRGLGVPGLSNISELPQWAIQGVLDGKVPIDAEISHGLRRGLGISAEFWMSLQVNYQKGEQKDG
jgi:plasmid maintenance system antidote protein VapI